MSAKKPEDLIIEKWEKICSETPIDQHAARMDDHMEAFIPLMALLVKSVNNLSATIKYTSDIWEQK